MTKKGLPASVEAEKGILSILLLWPNEFAVVADRLKAEHFYRDAHRTIFAAMQHLFERQQEVSMFTVQDYLEDKDELDKIGGEFYLMDLYNDVVSSNRLETLVDKVIKRAVLRSLIEKSGSIASLAYEATDDDVDTIVEQSEALIYEATHQVSTNEPVSFSETLNDFLDWFDIDTQGGAITGVPTGLDDLDIKTGGLQKSDLIIIAGRPAMGKTSLCMSLARNTSLKYQRNVLVFSLEMSKMQLTQRMIAGEARIDLQRIRTRNVTEEERARVIETSNQLFDAPIIIDDTPGLTLAGMRSKVRRALLKQEIDLIIVDYLQLVQATIDGKRIRERYQEVSEVARGLKDLAREFDIPVIALAQLSRAVESRADKIPQMSDLKESGEIEQAADIVMFIHREDAYAKFDRETGKSSSERPKTADLIFAKHRNGPAGEITVGFEASQTRFCNIWEIDMYAHMRPLED